MTDNARATLKRPFAKEDIHKDYNGFDYIEPRLVIERLDEAVGPDGWHFELLERIIDVESVTQFGRLGIQNESGGMVWKYNCGGMARRYVKQKPHELQYQSNNVTDFKGAASNCLKRCAMLWEVGLHLYGDAEHDADSVPGDPGRQESESGGEGRTQGMSDDDKAKFARLRERLAAAQTAAEESGVSDEEMDDLADKLIGDGKSGIEKYNAMKAYGVALAALTAEKVGQSEPGDLPEM